MGISRCEVVVIGVSPLEQDMTPSRPHTKKVQALLLRRLARKLPHTKFGEKQADRFGYDAIISIICLMRVRHEGADMQTLQCNISIAKQGQPVLALERSPGLPLRPSQAIVSGVKLYHTSSSSTLRARFVVITLRNLCNGGRVVVT